MFLSDFPSYDQLFEMWFPENTQKPTAFLVDTTEEAELIPDWVKIRLLESKSEKIVNSGKFYLFFVFCFFFFLLYLF